MPRHFLRDDDLSPAEQAEVLARAADLEAAARQAGFLVNAVQPDAIRLAPPLILSPAEADEFLAAWPAILDRVAA